MTLVFWIFSSVWSFHMKISSSLEDLETVMSASWMYFSNVYISISPSLNTVFLTRQYFDYEQWLTPPAAHSGFVGGVVDWNIFNPPTGSLMTRGCVDDTPCIREHPLRLFKVVDLRSWGPRNNPSENESSLRPNIGICGQLEQVQSPKNMSIASYTPPIMYIYPSQPHKPIKFFIHLDIVQKPGFSIARNLTGEITNRKLSKLKMSNLAKFPVSCQTTVISKYPLFHKIPHNTDNSIIRPFTVLCFNHLRFSILIFNFLWFSMKKKSMTYS